MESQAILPKPSITYNKTFVFSYAIFVALSGLVYGYLTGSLNTAFRIIKKVNEWENNDVLESIAVAMSFIGGILGCLTAGLVVAIGRRNLILLMNLVQSIGIGMTLIGNYWLFIIGRFIQGIGCGHYSTVIPLYLREISPKEIAGTVSSMFTLFIRNGVMATYAISMLLPRPSHVPHDDQWWRVELGFPIFVSVVQTIAFFVIFKNDTPKGCFLTNINKNNDLNNEIDSKNS